MWMDEVFERFCEKSPFSVMTRATLEHLFADSFLDRVFEDHARAQYTKELAFSTVAALLTRVVLRCRPSVRNAYVRQGDVGVTLKCVYEKLQHVEPAVCRALVEHTAARAGQVLDCWPLARRADPVAGLRLRVLDGNYLAGTQHRLAALRGDGAAALPGMSVVLRDDRTGLLCRLACREDAYTNERALSDDLLGWVSPDDLIVADRNFCFLDFLTGLIGRGASFVIRHHNQVKLRQLGAPRHVGRGATGEVYEQEVAVGPRRRGLKLRCVIIRRFEPTEDGDFEVRLLSNVAAEKASALVLAEVYLRRWKIENAFQEMTEQLRCEVDTLGYPKAALLCFSLAVCAYNLLAILKGALAAVHGQEEVEKELSTYALAQEISQDSSGLTVALGEDYWGRFAAMTATALAGWLEGLARRVRWPAYRKAKRSATKARAPALGDPPKKKGGRRRTHVSTARVLHDQHKNLSP
jgi:Transposase DDE domain